MNYSYSTQDEIQVFDSDLGDKWKVVLWDDDDHSYDYVVEMLIEICSMDFDSAYQHALEVDKEKRTIVFIGELEHAEFIQDRILEYGPDPNLERSKGSMNATLEQ